MTLNSSGAFLFAMLAAGMAFAAPSLGEGAADSSPAQVPTATAIAQPGGAAPSPTAPEEAVNPSAQSTKQRTSPVAIPPDRIEPDPAVPVRVIEVATVDPQDRPLSNVRVALVRERQSISEGNSSSLSESVSDSQGKLRFVDVPLGSDTQYRLLAVQGDVRYGTRPFGVDSHSGTRVLFHVYPVIRNVHDALVAGRSFLFIEPRDDVLHIEVFSELHNLGATTWVPDDINIRLPEGWKAFATNPGDPDLHVVKTDQGVSLTGAVTPGQHGMSYSFQIPSNNRSQIDLELALWPNTAEVQVATVTRSGLELEAEGYPAAQVMRSNGQKPMLVTGRSFARDVGGPPKDVHVTLRGLPIVGPGRWVAAALAALLAASALVLARRNHVAVAKSDSSFGTDNLAVAPHDAAASKGQRRGEHEAEREARDRLLDELVSLTSAHRKGLIGTETFEQARQTLVAACVRLERQLSSY